MEWNKTYHRRKICIIFFSVVLMSMVLCGRLVPEIKLFRFQKAEEAFEDLPDAEKAEEIKNLKNALNFARKVLVTEECDVLILDEVLGLVEAGVIEAEELRALFEAKGEYTSLILTGIYPAKEIWQYADEVTEMVTAYKADSSGQ